MSNSSEFIDSVREVLGLGPIPDARCQRNGSKPFVSPAEDQGREYMDECKRRGISTIGIGDIGAGKMHFLTKLRTGRYVKR